MKGIVKVISKNGGIMLEGSDKWINPSPEAKVDILAKLEEAKQMLQGNEAEIIVNEAGLWTGMSLIKRIEKQPTINPLELIRLKSMALSYAKDLCVGGKITTESLIDYSEKMYNYLKGELQ